jgi:hypothetical protein
MSKMLKIVSMVIVLAGALTLTAENAGAGGRHYHGYYGGYLGYPGVTWGFA